MEWIKAELSAGRAVLAEVTNYRKHGTPYDAELYITPLFNAEGRRTNFVSIHRDITERKRAENLLRQERNRAQQYLDIITCAFKCEHPVEVAESFTATHLYRIAQEALTNALKHARPEHILIALESDNGYPTLQIADDGTGFNSNEKSQGMGLKTMQYRASLIGANLAISPIDTGGTLVTCKVFGGRGLVSCDD